MPLAENEDSFFRQHRMKHEESEVIFKPDQNLCHSSILQTIYTYFLQISDKQVNLMLNGWNGRNKESVQKKKDGKESKFS